MNESVRRLFPFQHMLVNQNRNINAPQTDQGSETLMELVPNAKLHRKWVRVWQITQVFIRWLTKIFNLLKLVEVNERKNNEIYEQKY